MGSSIIPNESKVAFINSKIQIGGIDLLTNNINDIEYKISSHEAAYRPSTYDRKPILGVHKKYNNIFILNGLGSRGILHAPYLSKELISYIFYGKEINPEININRFL